jgi:hypothetical protein
MSPPIRDGSGNSIGAIRLGDGSEISEVRTGAGDVLFSAGLPDSVTNNLRIRYKFEDTGNTSTTTDSSNNNNDGTVNSGSFVTSNPLVGNGSFDLGVVDTGNTWSKTTMTQMIAFRTDSLSGSRIINNQSGRTKLAYEEESNNGYEFALFDGAFNTITSGDSRTGTIIFAAIKYDASTDEMEFLLGDNNTQMSSQGTLTVGVPETIGSPTFLGSGNPLNCDVDEFLWVDNYVPNSDIEQVRRSLI